MKRHVFALSHNLARTGTLLFRNRATQLWAPLCVQLDTNVYSDIENRRALARAGEALGGKIVVGDHIGHGGYLPDGSQVVGYDCNFQDFHSVDTPHDAMRICTIAELTERKYWVKFKEWADDGAAMTAAFESKPLLLRDEPGHALGAVGRLVWDHLSLLGTPVQDHQPFDDPRFHGTEELLDGSVRWQDDCCIRRRGDLWYLWPRLDPYKQPVAPAVNALP